MSKPARPLSQRGQGHAALTGRSLQVSAVGDQRGEAGGAFFVGVAAFGFGGHGVYTSHQGGVRPGSVAVVVLPLIYRPSHRQRR